MITQVENRKAHYDYFIEETFIAGIELFGTEVKAFRNKGADISGTFCEIKDDFIKMIGSNIIPMSIKGYHNFIPDRPRKLLLTNKEIREINHSISKDGYSCIPLKMFSNDKGIIKVLIGIAKGKKNYDRRQTIKLKDLEREEKMKF